MKSPALIFIILLSQAIGYSQIILERQVISCFALHTNNSDTTLCSTAGQIETATLINTSGIITQGFQQPSGIELLMVEWNAYQNACTELYEVHITNVSGCATINNVQIFWNGVLGTAVQNNLPTITTLLVTSANDCFYQITFNFATMDVQVLPCELIFYNFVSPNNDGSNEAWIIENINNEYYENNKVRIYNRWGIMIWQCDGYNNNDKLWQGTTEKGEVLPNGTYFFEIEINGNTQTGFIELMR
jgi:gliding motility-associated-like protein